MTATYGYMIGVGHDAGSLSNLEDIISDAPIGDPVPLGAVKRITLDQNAQFNGAKSIYWRWAAMSLVDFHTLINTYLGDFDTGSANVTIATRTRHNSYARYNAIMIQPEIGTDYRRAQGGRGAVEELQIQFRNLTATGEFSYEFSEEFNL